MDSRTYQGRMEVSFFDREHEVRNAPNPGWAWSSGSQLCLF